MRVICGENIGGVWWRGVGSAAGICLRSWAWICQHIFWVVPIDGNSAVLSARWVDCDIVMLLNCIEDGGGVVGGKYFDARFVYSKDEGGGKGGMGPKAWSIFHRGI